MKKLFFVLLTFVISVGAWGQTSTGNPNKLILQTEVDTILYEIGMVQSPSDRLFEFLQTMGCYDSTATDDKTGHVCSADDPISETVPGIVTDVLVGEIQITDRGLDDPLCLLPNIW